MSRVVASRRGRTRWLIVVPLAGLAIIVAGIVVLESLAPRVDPVDRRVDGLPPLALADELPCIRVADDEVTANIRAEFEPGVGVSSTQVYRCPDAFDGAEVRFVGEVVGDLLHRADGAWVQVNDDAYALETGPMIDHRQQSGSNSGISVWLPEGLDDPIEAVGRSDRRGDVVLVRGTLLRADPQDGGGITIRAEELTVLAPSLEIEPPLHTLQVAVAGVLATLALATTLWSRRVRRR